MNKPKLKNLMVSRLVLFMQAYDSHHAGNNASGPNANDTGYATFKMKDGTPTMETPFDRKTEQDTVSVQVDDRIYKGDEVIAYFNDILQSLLSEEKSARNRAQLYNMARILIKKRENNRASGVVYQALTRYPLDLEFMKLKTEIFIRAKDYESALETVTAALQEDPFDVSLLMMKARVHSLAGDDKGEEQSYQDMLRIPLNDYIIDRGKLIALRNLADLYFKIRRYSDAEQSVVKALKKTPDEAVWALYFSILAKLNKSDELRKARDEFARYRRARVYFDKGIEFETHNKFNLALANYKTGLEIFSDDASVNEKVGVIFMYRKKWYSKAEEFFKRAVELDPDHVSYRSNLVICLKNQGKIKEAFEEAKVAEKLAPMSNIHYLRQMAVKLGKEEEFIDTVKGIIDNDVKGDFPALRYEMGMLYEQKKDEQKAQYWFDKALSLLINKVNKYPNNWETYLDLGVCCVRMGKYKEAEGAFKAAENIKGADLEEIYECLVDFYSDTNQPEKATPYLQKLIQIKPGSMVNYLDLGINYITRMKTGMRKKRGE